MHMTPFGWIYLPVVIWILVRRREWLPSLLIVAACLHAPAVLVVGGGIEGSAHGVTPWAIACLAIFLHLCAIAPRKLKSSLSDTSTSARWILAGWLAFALVGIVSAFTLPFLFAGLPTYNTLETLSIAAGTSPLQWRTSNAVLALNLAIIAALFVYGFVARPLQGGEQQLIGGLVFASVLAAALSVAQRILRIAGWSDHWLVADSLNPSYHHTVGSIFWQDDLRMGWPFSEPSYASAWFAACLVVGMFLYLWSGSHRRSGKVMMASATLGLIGSFSATGIAAAAAGAGLVWAVGAVIAWRERTEDSGQTLKRHAWVALLALLVTSAAYGAAANQQRHFPRFEIYSTWDAVKLYITSRIADHEREGNTRAESNRVALRLIIETKGLGVGLGGNRASSYLLNLLSNVGIFPTLLLSGLLVAQWVLIWRVGRMASPAVALTAGGFTMFLAVAVGIPDLVWPAWWLWPVLAHWTLCAILGRDSNQDFCK